MVESAVTDIVSPAVSAEDPYCLLAEEVFTCYDVSSDSCSFECSNESLACLLRTIDTVECFDPCISSSLYFIRYACSYELFNVSFHLSSACLDSHSHTETVLSVVFEQRVAPCRSVTFSICCVRSCCARAAPD